MLSVVVLQVIWKAKYFAHEYSVNILAKGPCDNLSLDQLHKCSIYTKSKREFQVRGSIVVSIRACQITNARDRGSIPRLEVLFRSQLRKVTEPLFLTPARRLSLSLNSFTSTLWLFVPPAAFELIGITHQTSVAVWLPRCQAC